MMGTTPRPVGRAIALGLLSALASGAVYCAVLAALLSATGQRWGWPLAAGIVASIAIHETGHVVALARYGLARSGPIFIPGFGAFVRFKEPPADAHQDARIGLAGPVCGLGACSAAYLAYLTMRAPIWAAIVQVAAFINLCNLLPLWQLDGGRGFRPLSRLQRYFAALGIIALWLVTRDVLLLALSAAAVARAASTDAARGRDWAVLAAYLTLVVAFTWLAGIAVPGGGLLDRFAILGR